MEGRILNRQQNRQNILAMLSATGTFNGVNFNIWRKFCRIYRNFLRQFKRTVSKVDEITSDKIEDLND